MPWHHTHCFLLSTGYNKRYSFPNSRLIRPIKFLSKKSGFFLLLLLPFVLKTQRPVSSGTSQSVLFLEILLVSPDPVLDQGFMTWDVLDFSLGQTSSSLFDNPNDIYIFPVSQNMEREILVSVEYANVVALQWHFLKGFVLLFKKEV